MILIFVVGVNLVFTREKPIDRVQLWILFFAVYISKFKYFTFQTF